MTSKVNSVKLILLPSCFLPETVQNFPSEDSNGWKEKEKKKKKGGFQTNEILF